MRELREFVVFALFGLMLAVAVFLTVGGSLMVVWVGTDWAEGGGLFAVVGIGFVVVGAMLAWVSIFLVRRRVRARRGRAPGNDARVVQAPYGN